MSGKANYSYGEPPPIPNANRSIHLLALSDIDESIPLDFGPKLRLIFEMQRRAQMGLEKYGVVLQAHNGRNALRDALDEILDLIVYLKQHCEENKTNTYVPILYYETIRSALSLVSLMMQLENENDGGSGPGNDPKDSEDRSATVERGLEGVVPKV